MATPAVYQGMRYYRCCLNCPNRKAACSDRCADYQIAKTFKAAEQAEIKQTEPFRGRRRNVNGRK